MGESGINGLEAEGEKTTTPEDGWIDWHGGECPVRERSEVEVRYRAAADPARGQWLRSGLPAAVYAWHHDGTDDDIVAYRVVPA